MPDDNNSTFTILGNNLNGPGSVPVKFVAREIEFIRWWRMKHGSIAPFLNLSTYMCYPEDINQNLATEPIQDGLRFLLEYIILAQSLELDAFYWRQIGEKTTAGHQVVFPNLSTLLSEEGLHSIMDPFNILLTLLPNHALLALRHLSIDRNVQLITLNIPNYWSTHTLTHVFLRASITIDFWFSFIRAIPNLRWGYFDINGLYGIDFTTPCKCTLSQLTTLLVSVYPKVPISLGPPLSLMFTDLHLPALHTLSLFLFGTKSWEDHRAIIELYSVLKSTPAITKLFLQGNFLSFRTYNTAEVLATVEDIRPVWYYAPQLLDLQVNIDSFMSAAEKEAKVDIFVRNIFSSDGRWLDLQNPVCPIRILTVNDNDPANELEDDIISSIQRNPDKAPNVVLRMTTDYPVTIARAVRDGWVSRIY